MHPSSALRAILIYNLHGVACLTTTRYPDSLTSAFLRSCDSLAAAPPYQSTATAPARTDSDSKEVRSDFQGKVDFPE
jgi:hypothetical protein